MTRIRPPAVAGRFYPGDPSSLRAEVLRLFERARPAAIRPRAIVAPHAGYPFSGPVAASAYASLRSLRPAPERVILLGPAHRVPVEGLAASGAEAFRTPLGDVPIDRDAVGRALEHPLVRVLDAAHAEEHSLEVQLPFLQLALGRFRLVPLVVGDAGPDAVAEVIERVEGEPDGGSLIVVSSDLSHFLPCERAREVDRRTADAILAGNAVEPEQACGCRPINGLLLLARRRGQSVRLLDLRNSGETAGPTDRVVGYGAFAVEAGGAPARRPRS